jgi:hypothetical protein
MADPWKIVNHEYRAEDTLLCDKWNNKCSTQKDMSSLLKILNLFSSSACHFICTLHLYTP